MKVRTIKDVDEETWRFLKEMARRRGLKMGTFLKEIALGYRKRPSDSWSKILHAKPILSKKDAEGMLRAVAEMRNESGYRDVTIN